MSQETMTGWERVWAALNGEKPDRVPVVPMILNGAAATIQGLTQGQVYTDYELAVDAIAKSFDDLGGWDCMFVPFFAVDDSHLVGNVPYAWKSPGIHIPDDYVIQIEEREVLKYEDYDRIIQDGWAKFYGEDVLFRVSDMTPEELPARVDKLTKLYAKAKGVWAAKGVEFMYGGGCLHPFFMLSLGRSLIPFTEDLYFKPDIVEKALKRMTDDVIPKIINSCKHSGRKVAVIIEERASAYNYPLNIFERFWLPYTKQIVDALWSEGIISVFHLDTPWNKNLPLMKQALPKGSFCLQLDGTTDMVAAKEFMNGHCSFQGDVPASLISIGSREEVEAYCKKIIKEVGRDGGFILVNGCECPIDCQIDNLKAMIDVAKGSFY